MFSSSDDGAMMKQIQATHAPDGREVDAGPILHIIEDILRRALPTIDGVLHVRNISHFDLDLFCHLNYDYVIYCLVKNNEDRSKLNITINIYVIFN